MATIFISPLCALSSALFSARVLHHVLLIAAVAPLLALAIPLRRMPASAPLAALVGLHTIILWIWHMPAPYEWGLASVPAYWLMQASLRQRLAPLARNFRVGGAARRCTFCARGDHRADGTSGCLDRLRTTAALCGAFCQHGCLGNESLADQQLAGLLMWVPYSSSLSRGRPLVDLVELATRRANRMTLLVD